jgi:hypothetical protein
VGDDDSKIMEELVIDAGSGARGQTKDGTGAEKGREKCKKKVEAKFGGAAKQVVGEKPLPGSGGDDADRNTLQIPERVKRSVGDIVPDALLARVGRLDEGVVGWDGKNLGRSSSPEQRLSK